MLAWWEQATQDTCFEVFEIVEAEPPPEDPDMVDVIGLEPDHESLDPDDLDPTP